MVFGTYPIGWYNIEGDLPNQVAVSTGSTVHNGHHCGMKLWPCLRVFNSMNGAVIGTTANVLCKQGAPFRTGVWRTGGKLCGLQQGVNYVTFNRG